MQIRTRLTTRFSLIVTIILVLFSIAIYLISSANREDTYYKVLKSMALTEAKLYSKDVKEVDTNLLRIFDETRVSPFNSIEIIAVFDETGKLVYQTPMGKRPPVFADELIPQIKDHKEIRFKKNNNQTVWEYFEGNSEKLFVFINGYDEMGFDKLHFLAWVLVICCIIAIVVTFISGYFYPVHLLSPIKYIVELTEEITATSLDLRLPVGKNKDELDRLAITFNNMLQRLEESFEMKRDFISNASHELRTPLGVMMVQIEVALLSNRTPEEYKKTLASLLEDIKNLRGMMNSLLELTEANMQPGSLKLKPIYIDELLWQAKTDFVNQHRDFTVNENYSKLPEDHDKLLIQGNELLKIAFINIMNNGCKYSTDNTVEVSVESVDHEVSVIFKDKGIGIPAGDLKNVFHPFYRGSNAKAFPGNGLGLALSMKIIELHKGQLKIESKVDDYTTVTIILPKGKS